ncbi:MAG TPA: hypothetical protein VH088_15900 [Terriglobales bacterium]|nr:hypothetical protein [Terriglobales bacterium]
MKRKVEAQETRGSGATTARKIGGGDDGILPEATFHQMVRLERKRARRSAKPFLLVHLDVTRYFASTGDEKSRRKMLAALAAATRDTDILGWSKHEKVIGVMFIELGTELDSNLMATMLLRVSDVLRDILALEQFRRVDISFQRFPEQVDELSMPQLMPQLFALAGTE